MFNINKRYFQVDEAVLPRQSRKNSRVVGIYKIYMQILFWILFMWNSYISVYLNAMLYDLVFFLICPFYSG